MSIEDVYRSVAEVADQDVAGKMTARDGSQAPRSVQRAAGGEPLEKGALGIEDIDETEPRSGNVVLVQGVLLGVGDIQLAAHVLDVERGETSGDRRVGERTGFERDGRELRVEDIDSALAEVGGEQLLVLSAASQG